MMLLDTTGYDHEVFLAVVPNQIEPGYYKTHQRSKIVIEYLSDFCLPYGTRVKC